MAFTQVKPKFQITLPKKVRETSKIRIGDFVEATSVKGGILLRPKEVVDRVEDLNTQLNASEGAVKRKRTLGPFKSAKSAMKAVRSYARRTH